MAAGVPRWKRTLFGDEPRAFLFLLVPTLLAFLLDLVVRGGQTAAFWGVGKIIYFSSLLVSMATWMLPLFLCARLFRSKSKFAIFGVYAIALVMTAFATFGYLGQAIYFRVFGSYVGRDTIRLGIMARGTVADWFSAWSGIGLFVAMVVFGFAIVFGALFFIRKRADTIASATPILPAILFLGALISYWFDGVDSRYLQAAAPDTCFTHGVMHAFRAAVTGKWNQRQGVSVRTPAALPALTSERKRPPNVVVILTESVRADAICSDPQKCHTQYMDEVAKDRIPLGILTTQTPNTFSSCMILWTGLPPNAEFKLAHSAPVLWEIARAVGYKTAYFTSQNPRFEDFGSFVENAGIDTLKTGTDLGGMEQEQLGAPDERAADALIAYLHDQSGNQPYFALLHFSNTHQPYRTDVSLTPFTPETSDPLGDIKSFYNHYRNSVALQEKQIARVIGAVRASPSWDDTVVVFLSDHGEQFREHGGLYHNHSLYEEELHVPGFLIAGANALEKDERAALTAYASRRTYMQDMNATLVDLFGVAPLRATLPHAKWVTGRSLISPPPREEPVIFISTTTSVWEPDEPIWGARKGNRKAIQHPGGPFSCFDLLHDPGEHRVLPATECGDLPAFTENAFAKAK